MRRLTVSDNPNHVMNARRDLNDKLPAYAWPGGYPIVYYTGQGDALCPECATRELDNLSNGDECAAFGDNSDLKWFDVHYEDYEICVECNTVIPGAYMNGLDDE